MDEQDLLARTKDFGLRVIRMIEALPPGMTAQVIGRQLLRSATSVGANYRSACRGKSKADFIAKLNIVLEEADESHYWLELLVDSGLMPEKRLADLMQEANQLVAICTASINTARKAKRNETDG